MGLYSVFPKAQIVGVDIQRQPRYPFFFIQADAIEYPTEGFDFIWASPPCQAFSCASSVPKAAGHKYDNLIDPIRAKLVASKIPYIIENVVGAPLINPVMLCGLSFGLKLLRHRLFESNFFLLTPPHIEHTKGMAVRGEIFTVAGGGSGYRNSHPRKPFNGGRYYSGNNEDWSAAMGISWMTSRELSQAVPPVYSQFLARQYKPNLLIDPITG